MAEVLFYHLTESRLEDALPALVEKSLARGWKAVIQCGDDEALERLDECLWTWREDSFLPHATAGSTQDDARQPVLLTSGDGSENGAEIRFVTGGGRVESPADYKRVVIMFDGHDNAQLEAARAEWRALLAAGHDLTYWQQNPDGGWFKKS